MKKSISILLIITLAGSFMPSIAAFAKENQGKIDEKNVAPLDKAYKVAKGDVLEIEVYEETDLSGHFEVKEDGTIAYPLLGPIGALGLTKTEIENKITSLLKDGYLVNPYVRVGVGKFGSKNIIILGCVQKPGYISFPEDGNIPTLLKAIVLSGGFTGYAAVNGTKIIRTIKDGKRSSIDPHINDIISGRRQDVNLEPGDLIVVPERLF